VRRRARTVALSVALIVAVNVLTLPLETLLSADGAVTNKTMSIAIEEGGVPALTGGGVPSCRHARLPSKHWRRRVICT